MNAIVILSMIDFIARGGKITKVRLLSEGYVHTVSYIDGIVDGQEVAVTTFDGLTGTKRQIKGSMIHWAQENGTYIKATGILEEANWNSF